MSIQFDFYNTPSPEGIINEKKSRYHARVVTKQTLDSEDIIKRISERCTLSKGDITAVLSELRDVVKQGLLDGNNVLLNGLGEYSLTLEAPKDASPTKTHAQNISVKRIDFRADRKLRKEIMSEAHFERSLTKKHSAHISIYEVDALLVDYFEEHTYITRQSFETLCQFTKNTALRHLKRLVDEGRLINTNTSRNPNYEPAKGYYNK